MRRQDSPIGASVEGRMVVILVAQIVFWYENIFAFCSMYFLYDVPKCDDRVLCTKMVPVKSHNDFSRPVVEIGVV